MGYYNLPLVPASTLGHCIYLGHPIFTASARPHNGKSAPLTLDQQPAYVVHTYVRPRRQDCPNQAAPRLSAIAEDMDRYSHPPKQKPPNPAVPKHSSASRAHRKHMVSLRTALDVICDRLQQYRAADTGGVFSTRIPLTSAKTGRPPVGGAARRWRDAGNAAPRG
jgi:hypothetical protein